MSKSIYIGRIPFDYTEEQVAEVARSVGPISDVRLMLDKKSGKSKGFAFVEYIDKESAASAVRNLNDFQVGTQRLRVDYSEEGSKVAREEQEEKDPAELVSEVVRVMPNDEKTRLLKDFKRYSLASPSDASYLLQSSPQLAYALLQTMVELGKINAKTADKLISKDNKATKGTTTQASVASTPVPPPAVAVTSKASLNASASTPSSRAGSAEPQAEQSDSERDMIKKVMALSPKQVDELPEEHRKAVVELRAKVERGEISL